YLILEDAHLPQAASLCAQSRLLNNGQSCIAAKRFLLPRGLRKDFAELLMERMTAPRIGLPQEESTRLGPLAHRRILENTRRQLEQIQKEGSRRLWTKEMEARGGAFFPPQILLCQGTEPSLRSEEFFAPVALLIEYDELEQAIAMANATVYGLGGAVFSQDFERADEVARRLDCGFVAINDFVRSDPRLPFGGVKDSGFGRELGEWGVNEFINWKTVVRGAD
ncbi:MAG: succinate-semialdehyde dehydrogenase, partial [Bdellovibrio sp.]